MPDHIRAQNRIERSFRSFLLKPISVRRLFVVSLAGILLGTPPALAAEPRPAAPHAPEATARSAGALVIVGGGGMPDIIRDRFLQLAGGKKARLVVIPTASEEEDRIARSCNYWRDQGLASVEMLHTMDSKKANDPAFVKPLTEATAAWLGGGDQSRLASAYRGTAVERELRRLLARGGVIGGTSAGASIMSGVMITGGNPQARVGQGFDLLPDIVIDQHFQNRKRQKRLLSVLATHPHCLGLGIDEQTAVVVCGHTFTVMGKANVSVCLPPTEHDQGSIEVLKAGEGGDLFQLNRRVLSRLHPPHETKPLASTP